MLRERLLYAVVSLAFVLSMGLASLRSASVIPPSSLQADAALQMMLKTVSSRYGVTHMLAEMALERVERGEPADSVLVAALAVEFAEKDYVEACDQVDAWVGERMKAQPGQRVTLIVPCDGHNHEFSWKVSEAGDLRREFPLTGEDELDLLPDDLRLEAPRFLFNVEGFAGV
jgi:hypothetical protein